VAEVKLQNESWELRCGDCLDPVAGIASLADKSVDHVITDPPYSDRTHSGTFTAKTLGRKTIYEGIDFDCLTRDVAFSVAREGARVSSRWLMFFTDMEGIALWIEACEAAGLDYVRTCIWVKPDATPQFTGDRPASGAEALVLAHPSGRKKWNGGGKRNVYTHTRQPGGAPHPTTKPVSLMQELISDFTDPGDLILDPFAGSGTTGLACRTLGRRFIGWELNAEYHAIATRRIAGDEAKPRLEQPSLFGALK
jgi:site-specific DNA-methyltransferase (adenine-specific)